MSEHIILTFTTGEVHQVEQEHGPTSPDIRSIHAPFPTFWSLISLRGGYTQDDGGQHRSLSQRALTGYRLLNTSVILGIGIPKAIYSYSGQSVISPTLDWVGGIIFALL